MFKEVLREVVDRTEGGIAGLIMGFDGIMLENYIRGEAVADVETVGMEYSVILREIQRAAQTLEAGAASEVSIKAEQLTMLIRLLNSEYFIAMTLQPGGNLGKARYLLRTAAPGLVEQLS